MDHQTLYSLSGTLLNGRTISFEEFRGKVVLIVNTASRCGHDYQLGMLEELYRKYKNAGLEIIGFPSDQFSQEPLEGDAIHQHCSVNYGVTFPMMQKTKLHGSDAHPVYRFLADRKRNGKFGHRPKWNFYKYLIGRDGRPIDHFWTYRKPDNRQFRKAIEQALQMPAVHIASA